MSHHVRVPGGVHGKAEAPFHPRRTTSEERPPDEGGVDDQLFLSGPAPDLEADPPCSVQLERGGDRPASRGGLQLPVLQAAPRSRSVDDDAGLDRRRLHSLHGEANLRGIGLGANFEVVPQVRPGGTEDEVHSRVDPLVPDRGEVRHVGAPLRGVAPEEVAASSLERLCGDHPGARGPAFDPELHGLGTARDALEGGSRARRLGTLRSVVARAHSLSLSRPLPRRAAVSLLRGESQAIGRDEGRVGTSPRHELDLRIELPEVRLEVERDLPERGVRLRRSGLLTGSTGWS